MSGDWTSVLTNLKTLDEARKNGDTTLTKINKAHAKLAENKDRFNAKVGKKLLEYYSDASLAAANEKKLILALIEETKALEAVLDRSAAALNDANLKKIKRKSLGDDKTTPLLSKKTRTEEEAVFAPGAQVVVRPADDYILANIIRYHTDKQKYEVEDADDEDQTSTKKKYMFSPKQIIPIPPFDASKEFPESHIILALYPNTTCFYKAIVVTPPSRNMGGPSSNTYCVRFDDDGGFDRYVSQMRKWKLPRRQFSTAMPSTSNETISSEFRTNHVNIQMLSRNLHKQLFQNRFREPTQFQKETSTKLLEAAGFLGKQEKPIPDVELRLPKLCGASIEEHFRVLGLEQAEPYLTKTKKFAGIVAPPKPTKWSTKPGWTRYEPEKQTGISVEFPDDDAIAFDVENMWSVSPFSILAVAMSERYWYSWVSPELANILSKPKTKRKSAIDKTVFKSLVALGLSKDSPRVVVGHNVSYDRARALEDYNLQPNAVAWIDTLSLHSAVGGLSSQQRAQWIKYQKTKRELSDNMAELQNSDDETLIRDAQTESVPDLRDCHKVWMDFGATNSLKTVAKLYTNKEVSKDPRKIFESGSILEVVENFQHLVDYCATDVKMTHEVLAAVFPKFLEKCPHPVSFAGMVEMGRGYLPTTVDWDEYIQSAEKLCRKEMKFIESNFLKLAKEALKLQKKDKWKADPWLKRLNWTPVSERSKILKKHPQWYRDLWDSKEQAVKISSSKRIAPYLLKLTWKEYPLYYSKPHGWTYMVPNEKAPEVVEPKLKMPSGPEDKGYDASILEELKTHTFFRVPHKDGEEENCGNPLSKSYIASYETGILASSYPVASEILKKKAMCSYWISARTRIMDQLVVTPGKDHPRLNAIADYRDRNVKVILPQLVVMGTVTRRAVESTWLTAANAKKNRIGSELKTLIRAPKGYALVGADVDSEELWICSLLGDSQFGIHGATPIGFMTLQGTKSKGTDLHTVTGKIVNISRDAAKIFNYSRFYGAGAKHSVQLLMQHSLGITKDEATGKIRKLFEQTKGTKSRKLRNSPWGDFWYGGTESYVFNTLEKIANSGVPQTPVLGCTIPDSLLPQNVESEFATSRVNWVVQSSGVDYLHLLLVSMNYLMRRLKIKGRFMLSIHDEVRYLVETEDADLAALALQISNLWTRTIFATRLGIDDLPLNIAFFSAVDIDHCLRKEVDQQCVTPTNVIPIENGRSSSIYDTIKIVQDQRGNINSLYGNELESVANIVVPAAIDTGDYVNTVKESDLDRKWLTAQMCKTRSELEAVVAGKSQNKKKPNSRKSGKQQTQTPTLENVTETLTSKKF